MQSEDWKPVVGYEGIRAKPSAMSFGLDGILSEHGVNTLEDASPVGLTHIWKDIDARVKAMPAQPAAAEDDQLPPF